MFLLCFFSFFLFLIEIPVVYANSVDPDQRSGSALFAYVPNLDTRHEKVKGTAECFNGQSTGFATNTTEAS